jgi:F0F1-type ATP synthase membrane subunit b/b'
VKTIVYVMFLALCAFLIVGWFLDWYAVQDIRSTSGRHRLEIEINTEKIQQDIERGRKKLEETWRRMQQPDTQASQAHLSLNRAER